MGVPLPEALARNGEKGEEGKGGEEKGGEGEGMKNTYGTSEGVTGSLGGGGRLMRVGACDMVDVRAWTVEGVIYGVTDRHVRVVAI